MTNLFEARSVLMLSVVLLSSIIVANAAGRQTAATTGNGPDAASGAAPGSAPAAGGAAPGSAPAAGGAAPGAAPGGAPGAASGAPGAIDVTKHGAKPDSDITEALLAAWKEACSAPGPSSVVIPAGTFITKEVELTGPCKAPIGFQLVGTLKATPDLGSLKEGAKWISFNTVAKLTISGGGTFDGQGAAAWKANDCRQTGTCNKLPNNLFFHGVTDSVIQDVTTKDSKLFHVTLNECSNMTFQKFTVSAPAESLNTDGIHVGRSKGVNIIDCKIETGDDCISIGDGSEQVKISKVTCGPGHGISVGSLGKYDNELPVTGIFVNDCTFIGTDNGVRIKTWQNTPKPGTASDIHFESLTMNNVKNPIIIDQEYCPAKNCAGQKPSDIKLSKISFKNIKGTSTLAETATLVCSSSNPCDNVEVADIDISFNGGPGKFTCTNVKPTFTGKMNPPACA